MFMNKENVIAPCGMNCSICARYLALKNDTKNQEIKIPYCSGCRKKNKCTLQKKCKLLNKNKIDYCFECPDFPCKRLQKLDQRYRTHYRMSMIENLEFIKKHSLSEFIEKDKEKWQCSKCGRLISCHNGLCFKCDLDKLLYKKKLYRWE